MHTRVLRGYLTAFKLLNCCQKVYCIWTGWPVSVHSFISRRFQTATSQIGSADVNACSDNELVDVGNNMNEARFTFSQIHQYLQYVAYPSYFQSLTNRLCKRDLSSSRVLMAIFYYVGGGKLYSSIPLASLFLFSIVIFWTWGERILIDRTELFHQSTTHHTLGSTVDMWCFCTLIICILLSQHAC